jgi:hypothetical protein
LSFYNHFFVTTFRYIYVPIMGDGRGVLPQLFAATMCFSFVYLWHGIMPHVLIWSFLNYFGVVIEAIAKAIWRRDDYQRLEVINFSTMFLSKMQIKMQIIFSEINFITSRTKTFSCSHISTPIYVVNHQQLLFSDG